MKVMTRTLLTLALGLLCLSPLRAAQETRPPMTTIVAQLNAELPNVGDFALIDSNNKLLGVGRVLLSFSSVYEIMATGKQATGECEFVYVPYKDGVKQQFTIQRLKYWFDFGPSVIRLNTAGNADEIRLDIDLDLTQEFAKGVIRAGVTETSPEAGSVRMRIKDAAPAPAPAR